MGQRLIAIWIILDLIVIALFGSYILSRRDVIKNALEIVKNQGLLKNIDSRLDLPDRLLSIEVDPHQLT